MTSLLVQVAYFYSFIELFKSATYNSNRCKMFDSKITQLFPQKPHECALKLTDLWITSLMGALLLALAKCVCQNLKNTNSVSLLKNSEYFRRKERLLAFLELQKFLGNICSFQQLLQQKKVVGCDCSITIAHIKNIILHRSYTCRHISTAASNNERHTLI